MIDAEYTSNHDSSQPEKAPNEAAGKQGKATKLYRLKLNICAGPGNAVKERCC
jgi:hypothetical protein